MTTPTKISEQRFEDASGLSNALSELVSDARLSEYGPTNKNPKPVVYVLDANGTQFSKATLMQEQLTDGSKVYHIVLEP